MPITSNYIQLPRFENHGSILNSNSEFGCIWLSYVLLLWDFWGKIFACRKQPFNHLGQQMVWRLQGTWALQVEFSSPIYTSREGIRQYLFGLHQASRTPIWLQVIAFWGGPYRFTWFGAFFNTSGPSLTKVVYAYFDGSSYIYPFPMDPNTSW